MIQNRYLIVQPIGKGGMGEVYLAVDQRLGSAVALKRTFFNEDDALQNAFEREARILARLRHPVLPKVIDHFMENGDQFLVMEHISGDDVAKRIENANKPFPLSWVMFWADQMLDALSYLHSHEPPIIHRDIKPQNLKLTDENHIVILDFGLSKDFDTSSSSQPLQSGSVVGYSPHFAPMEQVRGTGTDARSDLYSLSATLYQMMTNTIPADSLSRADALLGKGDDPIFPINEINEEVPPAVSEVILKGLAIRQGERYSTAIEMQKALRRAFNQGKADAEDRVMSVGGDLPVAETKTTAPQSDASEMTTRMRSDETDPQLEQTSQMDTLPSEILPVTAEQHQSDIKTAIFTAPEIKIPQTETETKLVPVVETAETPPTAVAAAAGSPGPSAAFKIQIAEPEPAPQPRPVVAARNKKSKGGLVIVGLLGFLLVGAIVVGGWYGYNKFNAGATPAVSPTPVAAVSPSPSPALVVESNQNNNANSNVEQVSGANNDDANANRAVSTTSTPDPVATRQTPQVTTKPTPVKTTQAPTAKATPKPKQKDERAVILQ